MEKMQAGVELLEQLRENGLLTSDQAAEISRMMSTQDVPLSVCIIQNNYIAPLHLAEAVARYFEIPLYDLDQHNLDLVPNEFVHLEFVKRHLGLPLLVWGDRLVIAVIEPNLPELRDLSFFTGLNTEFVLVEIDKLKRIIDSLFADTAPETSGKQVKEFVETMADQIGPEFEDFEIKSLVEADDVISADDINDTPVVRFVNKVLIDAVASKSSDIHLEPYEKICRVRYRQDGVLKQIVTTSKKLIQPIIARLKIMANLDIAEHRKPQDGRFSLVFARGQPIDIRLSTCPTVQGEKIVMRILDPKISNLDISDLGMNPIQKEDFLHAIRRPQGMILVTGPTGSGKTVTLYAGLQLLNSPEVNISSIEDPVEINMQGINQVQVNLKIGLTFAEALRSFLRQDPDIIMVGEIRDRETAEISFKAAQTGHLVLSTLHTNSAPLTITRLISMGIKPYNVTSALTLVMAQRLARKLCSRCKQEVKDPRPLLDKFKVTSTNPELRIFEPVGCNYCSQGFRGRTGIFEVMPVTDELNEIIFAGGSTMEIEAYARRQKILSLRESGIEHVLNGETSFGEISRVVI